MISNYYIQQLLPRELRKLFASQNYFHVHP